MRMLHTPPAFQLAISSFGDASAEVTRLEPGGRVNWNNSLNSGHGVHQLVPAVVDRIGPKLVLIGLRVRQPYSRSKLWEATFNWVKPETLKPRLIPCHAFREEMRLELDGFVLVPWKHAQQSAAAFPNGIWYGAISTATFVITAPCLGPDQALAAAVQQLRSGGYRAQLLTSLGTIAHWWATGQVAGERAAEVRREEFELCVRLLHLFQTYPHQIQPGDPSLEKLAAAIAHAKDANHG